MPNLDPHQLPSVDAEVRAMLDQLTPDEQAEVWVQVLLRRPDAAEIVAEFEARRRRCAHSDSSTEGGQS